MTTIISDPERWWREQGQFIPPCDKMHDRESLEIFKQFTLSIAKTLKEEEELFSAEIDDVADEAYEKGYADGQAAMEAKE